MFQGRGEPLNGNAVVINMSVRLPVVQWAHCVVNDKGCPVGFESAAFWRFEGVAIVVRTFMNKRCQALGGCKHYATHA